MALGINFEHFGSLCSPVLGLIIFLGTYVELVQKVLDITLVINDQKVGLQFLTYVQLLVRASLAWCISASPTSLLVTGTIPMVF